MIRLLIDPLPPSEEGANEVGANSLLEFIRSTKPNYNDEKYHQRLCAHIDDLLAGKIPRLMVFMPPQHGKSQIVSRHLPAFALGRNPELRIAACTYAADFAEKFNRDVQRIIASMVYRKIFPGVKLNDRKTASDEKGTYLRNSTCFEIVDHGGSYTAVGVGGPLTGKTVDLGIIDDPVKDSLEAQSTTYRNRMWEWYTDVFSTRLHNESRVVFTCTRWHEDDLAGRIIAKEPSLWKVYILPGIREEGEPYAKLYPRECLLPVDDDRLPGEALWPARHSREKLLQAKANSERMFAAMIQQRPAPSEGTLIHREWIRYYRDSPPFDKIIQSWDLAFEGTDSSDFVACTVWGKAGPNAYLLYMKRGKWNFGQTIAEMRRMQQLFPHTAEKLIEDKANGPAAIYTLRQEIPGIVPVPVEQSKECRAWAASYLFESGNVFFPTECPWTAEVVEELASFPNGRYDDIVDTITQALTHLYMKPQGRAVLTMI